MAIDGVSGLSRVFSLPEIPAAAEPFPSEPVDPASDFEATGAPAPVDLRGGPPPQTDWAAFAGQQQDLWSVDEAAPVQFQAMERPPTAVDPNKVGVVLNDHPLNLPSAQELRDLGVTGARISLTGANFTPETGQAWQDRLAEYRDAGIEVTLNLPRELEDSGTFPEPPGREHHENGTWSLLPSDQQPQEWKDAFNDWKYNQYLPRVQQVLDTVGGSASAFEIWNEPDEPGNREDYSPGIPAGQFGELLRDVYGMVHGPDADPDAGPPEGQPRIITGGLDSGNTAWLDGAFVDGKLYADTLGVHPYLKRPDENYDEPGNWTGTVADIARDYSRFGKTIELTEAGDRRGFSPPYIPELATAAGREENVGRSYFFWDDPYDGEFGLMGGRDDAGQPIYRAGARELQERIRQWNEGGVDEAAVQ